MFPTKAQDKWQGPWSLVQDTTLHLAWGGEQGIKVAPGGCTTPGRRVSAGIAPCPQHADLVSPGRSSEALGGKSGPTGVEVAVTWGPVRGRASWEGPAHSGRSAGLQRGPVQRNPKRERASG